MSNILKHDQKEFIIDDFIEKEKLIYNLHHENIKINFYDKEFTENVINTQFNNKYKRLLKETYKIINDDDNDDDGAEIILNKIEEFKKFILNKYGKFLSQEVLNKYLKMLNYLCSELEHKIKENVIEHRNR